MNIKAFYLSILSILLTSCYTIDDDLGQGVVTQPETTLSNITTDTTLNPNITYNLNSSVVISNNATLTIPAGTKIKASAGGTQVYLAVEKGSIININGTSDTPVVMSSTNGNAGDWGGLVICGNAVTTAGIDAEAEISGLVYGGTNNADSSGSISYLVLRGTGAAINSESEYNGISFYAVGSGTSVDNIAVINGNDDGVEFFGGSVSATNIYLKDCGDDAVDWTEGWNGTLTNTYVKHDNSGFSTAVEADKEDGSPVLNNFTAISSVEGIALQFKKESGAHLANVYISGYEVLIDLKDHKDGNDNNVWGENDVQIDGTTLTEDPSTLDSGTAVDISGWIWKDATL